MSVRYRNMAGMACLAFCGVIFAAVCFGDAARFKGGSYDGYDWNSVETQPSCPAPGQALLSSFGELHSPSSSPGVHPLEADVLSSFICRARKISAWFKLFLSGYGDSK